MQLEPVTLDPRRALQVTRFHTWPRIREQSVGEHSMQVMRILLAIYPGCPRNMLVYCLEHDLGETVCGDPPYPIKALNPDLKAAHTRIEAEAVKLMTATWMLPHCSPLSRVEALIFKLAEFIEMWEWGLFEEGLGNKHAELVSSRCAGAIAEHLHQLASYDGNAVDNAERYLEKRGWVLS
jgi:5'-deoxynucleotidase YfbR-like HD superfamily hydrolase